MIYPYSMATDPNPRTQALSNLLVGSGTACEGNHREETLTAQCKYTESGCLPQ